MDNKDNILNDKRYEKLLHNKDYYTNVFKRTEKTVAAVFYVLHTIDIDKKSETHSSNLASKTHFAHENALRSLEVKPATATEVLEQFAQSLIGLDSTLRVAATARLIPREALLLLTEEIAQILHALSGYLDNDSESIADLLSVSGVVSSTRSRSSSRAQSSSRQSVATSATTKPAATSSSSTDERRERIKTIIEAKGEASIKDISDIITDISEKTIQRELNTMIDIGQVRREGERRWSKYLPA